MFNKTLRRCGLLAVAGALLMAGCGQMNQAKPISTVSIKGQQCLKFPVVEDEDGPMYMSNNYELTWPAQGAVGKEVELEMIRVCFGDSTATTFDQALTKWRMGWHLWFDANAEGEPIDSSAMAEPWGNIDLRSYLEQSGRLATFTVASDVFHTKAAHGVHDVAYLMVDRDKDKVVHLADLMDTTHLAAAIYKAVSELDTNSSVKDCINEEYLDGNPLPLSQNFFIDSARHSIVIVYELYRIAPYPAGIQSVVLPIDWLAKEVVLTPYAKNLFGISDSQE